MKKAMVLAAAAVVAGCGTDSEIASRNLSRAAEMFEISRRVVFYNGITGDYMLTIEGRCSVDEHGRTLAVTCKTGHDPATGAGLFKKHYLGLSDNVTYFSEQVSGAAVSAYHYRVIFKPQTIVPDVDARGDVSEMHRAVTPD